MAKKNPENKEWYIKQNSEYAEYVSFGKEELEGNDGELSKVKKMSVGGLLLTTVVVSAFVFGGMYLLGSFTKLNSNY